MDPFLPLQLLSKSFLIFCILLSQSYRVAFERISTLSKAYLAGSRSFYAQVKSEDLLAAS
jgi:hypothetical protein